MLNTFGLYAASYKSINVIRQEGAVGTQTGQAMTTTCEEQVGRVAAPALASANNPA